MNSEYILENPEAKKIISEYECNMRLSFMTSKGIKRIEPGKIYNSEFEEQPERLNPEDARDSVCDSLNTTNK